MPFYACVFTYPKNPYNAYVLLNIMMVNKWDGVCTYNSRDYIMHTHKNWAHKRINECLSTPIPDILNDGIENVCWV